jgi:predicted nucleotidyltransferase component of viral defense system
MIRALSLLEGLVTNELNFVFKGGTSLILIAKEPRRFSVDIDIITKHTQKDLENAFDAIVAQGSFVNWELDAPRSYGGSIPKAHYFFYYNSTLNKASNYVLLDILFEDHLYPATQEVEIQSSWIKQKGAPVPVTVPTIESICGDKLCAFAPNTTGVLYGDNKSLEIVKQLHDVGHLFDGVQDVEIVAKSFEATCTKELKYRELSLSFDDVLDDVVATALLLGKSAKHHSADEKKKYEEFTSGLDQFKGYLMFGSFHREAAIESAAKAAYLAAKIKTKEFSALKRYDGKDVEFQFQEAPYNTLNPLRKIRNASMLCWSQIADILKLN